MPSRRWWVVLVLAAVFSMHGVLLTSPHAGDGDAAALAGQHATAGSAAMGPLPGASAASPLGTLTAAPEEPTREPAPDHGTGAHVWSLCLAVLAGLALLGALVLTGRTSAAGGTAVQYLRRMGRWSGLPRPPDLAALCLSLIHI